MRAVLTVMADDGTKIRDAAMQVGMNPDAAVRAYNRPHVKKVYNQMVADVRRNASQEAYLKINRLAQAADNEEVKLAANQWIAGVDGLAPVKRVVGRHVVSHEFTGFEYGDEPG